MRTRRTQHSRTLLYTHTPEHIYITALKQYIEPAKTNIMGCRMTGDHVINMFKFQLMINSTLFMTEQ